MESQFLRIEGYGRHPSKRKSNGRSMEGVAFEAERQTGYCSHVKHPKPPITLFGGEPREAVRLAAERAEQAVDGADKKLRCDALIFLGGVASYPVEWERVRNDDNQKMRLRRWLKLLLKFLKAKYPETLCYVLLHTDERYPHVHWGAVPKLEPNKRMRLSSIHPGHAASERIKADGGTNAAAMRAYKRAMVELQDAIHAEVYAPVGIARVGPRRQRLTRGEYKARQKADQALAITLDTEQELKAKWRTEIAAKFQEEISSWKHRCASLAALLTAANKEISDLKAQLSALENQLKAPNRDLNKRPG